MRPMSINGLASRLKGKQINDESRAIEQLCLELGRAIPGATVRQALRTETEYRDAEVRIMVNPKGGGDRITGWSPARGDGKGVAAYRLMHTAPAALTSRLAYAHGATIEKTTSVAVIGEEATRALCGDEPGRGGKAWRARRGIVRGALPERLTVRELVLEHGAAMVGIDVDELSLHSWRAAIEQLAVMANQQKEVMA